MNKIQILDDLTIQKIAAGEIIERPASIVKELIENSLDANSSNITIEINNGGKTYIRITDDGDGIFENDLQLAFKRHSTSKLSNIDDLYRIMSFGFRGEALASISTVSKVQVLTKPYNSLRGIQALVEEGEIVKQQPIGCPKGTTMIVKDLFYNVPVRKKFLKSDIVESNSVSDIVYRLALGNYNISFKYIKDNRVVFRTSKNNDLASNIYILLGKDFSNNLLNIDCKAPGVKMHGYISNNTFYRSNRTHQYLYVNNRYIKNDHITSLIENKYKSIIPINKFPIYILFIDMDPSLIDVNIHPTKQEIKFINQQQIDDILDSLIDSTLKSILSIPNTLFKQHDIDEEVEELPRLYENIFGLNQEKTYSNNGEGFQNSDDANLHKVIESHEVYVKNDPINVLSNTSSFKKNDQNENNLTSILSEIKPIGTVFSTYILAEAPESNKLLIIDQHAAHERIMYEKYLKEYKNEKVVIQNLLSPEIIELTNIETTIVMNNLDLFKKLGFVIEEFGTNSVIIRGVPMLFGKPYVKELFLELVDTIQPNTKTSYEVKLNKIIKIACTKAIKSGDKMTNIEVISLFEQLSRTSNPYTCPHGRPTIIEVSRDDLEKEFKRIM